MNFTPTSGEVQTDYFEGLLQVRKDDMTKQEVTLGSLNFKGDNLIELEGENLRLSPRAQRQILKDIGIPKPYFDRIEPSVQEYLWEYHTADREKDRFYPIILDEKIVGWSWEKAPLIPLLDFYTVISEEVDRVTEGRAEFRLVGGRGGSHDTFFDEYGGQFSWVSDSLNVQPRVGDIVQGGIRLFACDWNSYDPSLQSFATRLVCTNGMVAHDNDHNYNIAGMTSDAVLASLRERARQILNNVNSEILEPLAETVNHMVEEPMIMVNRIIRDRGLPQRIAGRFAENVESLVTSGAQEITFYDIINELTNVQNDESINLNQRHQIQWVGTLEAREHNRRCKTCHHVV